MGFKVDLDHRVFGDELSKTLLDRCGGSQGTDVKIDCPLELLGRQVKLLSGKQRTSEQEVDFGVRVIGL